MQQCKNINHKFVAASAWMSRGLGAVIQLHIMRTILSDLGPNYYAVYVLLTGMIVWFGLADFGMSYALQNKIAKARALNQSCEAAVKSVFSIGLTLYVLFAIIFILFHRQLSKHYLGHISEFTDKQKDSYMLITLVLGTGGGIGNIIMRSWYGEDEGWRSNIMLSGMWLCCLGINEFAVRSSLVDRLLWCLLALFAPFSIIPLVAMLIRYSRSKVRMANLSELIEFSRVAVRFWAFGIMSLFVLNTDIFIMAKLLNSQQITVYTMVNKVLGMVLLLYSMVLAAIWPMSTRLFALKRWSEVIKIVKTCMLWGWAGLLVVTYLLCSHRDAITNIMCGGNLSVLPSYSLIIITGGYYIIRIWTDSFSMLLLSTEHLSMFWKWVPLQATLSVISQYLFASKWGAEGLVAGIVLSFLLTVSWVLPIQTYNVLNQKIKTAL